MEPDQSRCARCGTELAPARREAETGRIAALPEEVLEGKWRLEQKLGEGGMGAVYLAHDLQLDRKVAVKLLAEKFVDDQELVARFEREARFTASLEHPNIVPVYAVGRAGKRPYIVMKKLEGMTLAEHLRHHGTLVDDDLLYVMKQLCSGLEFIHARGFVHRDLKSQNIFLGSDGHATILDFGILHSRKKGEALTRAGMVMGTPEYMSPEQALGRDIDHRADLYALAVILFECISGSLPFTAENDLELIQLQAHHAPPELSARAPSAPAAMVEVMRRALDKLPERRFGSAGELYRATERAFTVRTPIPLTRPVAATPAAVATPPSAPHRALPLVPLALGAAAFLLAGMGIAWKLAHARRPSRLRPRAVAALRTPPPAEGPASPAIAPTPGAAVVDPAPARRAPSKPGQLNVQTTVKGEPFWANVFVNGAKKGNTPVALQLPAGTHKVRLVRSGFKPVLREVRIAPGERTLLRIELTP